jgi:hypothetical protein
MFRNSFHDRELHRLPPRTITRRQSAPRDQLIHRPQLLGNIVSAEYSAIARENLKKGKASRFKKVEKGKFALKGES